MDQRLASSTFPALKIGDRGDLVPLPGSGTLLMGRGPGIDLRFDDDLSCSRRQAELRCDDGVITLVPLSQGVETRLNDRAVTGMARLVHGDVIAFGTQRITFLAHDEAKAEGRDRVPAPRRHEPAPADPPSPPPAPEPRRGLAVPAVDMAATEVFAGDMAAYAAPKKAPSAAMPNEIRLEGELEFGRMEGPNSVVLDHPMVSRRHTAIIDRGGAWVIRDLGSTNGTFVNGVRLTRDARLEDGNVIDIGPFSLRFERGRLVRESRVGNIRLTGLNLTRTVQKRGGPLTILNDVTVAVEPNEFVCLLGPSGSGKTTLMNALSAREPASSGAVYVNSVSLYDNFDVLKEDMALVPQHDMLHEFLTLGDALTYTARLRLPPDQSRAGIRREVERVAESVGMTHRLGTRIASLSGGQKKRASLASETLSRPSLLFLDEVTSGLDEATDYEIMKLLRGMSEGGMTTVCVTHTLANVEEFCHKLVIMANPGVLTFSGTPAEAIEFFRVKRLADIYRRLEERPGQEWQRRYQASELHTRYIERPVEQVRETLDSARNAPHRQSAPGGGERRGIFESARQFAILSARNAKLLLADGRTLAMAFAQAGILGILLGYVFSAVRSPGPLDVSYLFMLAVTAFWIGCNGASKEIVKERPIYLRERDVNLSVFAYYLSKVLVNGVFVIPQVLLVFLMVLLFGAPIPGNLAAQAIYMNVAGIVGTALGLMISACSNSRDQATTLVPLALVPQIVLAGVIVPNLPALAEILGKTVISAYWLNEGMVAVCERCPRPQGTAMGQHGAAAFLVLVVHAALFVAIGYAVMLIRDMRGSKTAVFRMRPGRRKDRPEK